MANETPTPIQAQTSSEVLPSATQLASPSQALIPPSPELLKKELALRDPASIDAVKQAHDGDLDQKADQFVDALLGKAREGFDAKTEGKQAVETMGMEIQRRAAAQSEMLKQPIDKLSKRGAEGGEVANSLIDLKVQVEALDPNKLDLNAGWFSRTLGMLPGVGTPLKRYFTKYESAQTVIAAIIQSLEKGKEQLARDNVTLVEDQKKMHELTRSLEKAIQLGQLIDNKLQYKLDRELTAGSDEYKYVAEELLFPLRQRIMDLQQQLAVNQQGIIAIELIIRNNKELIRGVNRALSVTVSALQVAVTVALALENQKIVLDKLDAVNKTTSDLIQGTAQRLRTQGAEIQKRAASATLDMDALRSAFKDLTGAIDDLSAFRMKALPTMASTVLELNQMNLDTKKVIDRMEQAKKRQGALAIEVDGVKS